MPSEAPNFEMRKLGAGTEVSLDKSTNNNRLWVDSSVTVFSSVGAYEPYVDSVFRIVPYLELDRQANKIFVDPFRYKINKRNTRPVFGNWCYQLTLVEFFGKDKKHMALETGFGKQLSIDEYRSHPYVVLREEIRSCVVNERLEDGSKVNPDWFGYIGKTTLKSCILPAPKRGLICRVLVYKLGNTIYFSKQDGVVLTVPAGWPSHPETPYCLLVLHGTALEAFIGLVEERINGDVEDETDLSLAYKVFKHPDLVHPEYGEFVYFYRADTDPREAALKRIQAAGQNSDDFAAVMQSRPSDQKVKPYACFTSKYFPWYLNEEPGKTQIPSLARSTLSGKSLPILAETQKEWKDILKFYSLDEQIEIINSSFPPDLLVYAYRHHPQYLTSTTRSLQKNTQYSFATPQRTPTFSNIMQQDELTGEIEEPINQLDVPEIPEDSSQPAVPNPYIERIKLLAKENKSGKEAQRSQIDELL